MVLEESDDEGVGVPNAKGRLIRRIGIFALCLWALLATFGLYVMWPYEDDHVFTSQPSMRLMEDPTDPALVVTWSQDPGGYNSFWFSSYAMDESRQEIYITRRVIHGVLGEGIWGEPSDAAVIYCKTMNHKHYKVFINEHGARWLSLGDFTNPL